MEEEEFWEVPAFLTKPEILEQMDLSKVQVPDIDLRPDYWIWVKEILENTLRGHEVCAFGSRAKWTNQEGSDLDLVVMDAVSSEEICAAKSAFQDSLLPIKVDIGQWHSMSEDFQNRIKKDLVTLTSKKNALPESWRKVKLGDVCEISSQRGSPSASQYLSTDSMHPNVGGVDFSKSKTPQGKTAIFHKGDTLFSNIRTYFRKVWLADRDGYCSNDVLVFTPSAQTNQSFLFYLLTNPLFTEYSCKTSKGAKMPRGDKEALKLFELLLPPLREQEAIAGVLSALDDKIAHNKAQNKLLEEMAQTLFKDWFVHFGPTREKTAAKEENRPEKPYLEPEIWSLFPDTLTPDGIPEGWEEKPLDEIVNVIYGAAFSSKKFNEEKKGRPLIRIRDLKTELPSIYTEEVHKKGFLVKAGTLLTGMDGDFSSCLWGGDDAWLNQRVCAFTPKKNFSMPFVHNTIIPQLKFIEKTETATTVIHLGKSDIDNFTYLSSPPKLSEFFNEQADPLYKKIISNKQENKKLAEMRDALLPQLISGRIRVKA